MSKLPERRHAGTQINLENYSTKYRSVHLQYLTFALSIIGISNHFIASNKLLFIFTNEKGQKEHALVALPTLLLTTCKIANEESVIISNLSVDEVLYYNKITANSGELLILPNNTMDISRFIIDTP